jgi:hypothetical protein
MWTHTRFEVAVVIAMSWPSVSLAQGQSDSVKQDEDDPAVAPYRERFKQGLDRYDANDVAGALSFWEPLYRDLGPTRGYRVGYNLARAYEVFGDATRAAERYHGFLDELKQRRTAGKPVDALVEIDEQKATERLDDLGRTRGRIHIAATTPPESVRIDQSEPRLAGFVAYVAPGPHAIVFQPGSAEERTEHVEVQLGELIEVVPKQQTAPPPLKLRETTTHPFSSAWLWGGGVMTLVIGGGLTATAYANAVVLHDRSLPTPTPKEVSDYNGARTLAYVSWAAPATFAVITVILVAWYAVGTKHAKMPMTTGFAF